MVIYRCLTTAHVNQTRWFAVATEAASAAFEMNCFPIPIPNRIIFPFQGTSPVTFLSVKKYFRDGFLCNYHRCYSIAVFFYSCLFRKLKVFIYYWLLSKWFFPQLKLGKNLNRVQPTLCLLGGYLC